MAPPTQRERDAAKRQTKLEEVQTQIENGSLTVRQMTDEEKAKYARHAPVRPARPKRAR